MLTKYASLENVKILELKGSRDQVRHASLGKLADFDSYRTSDGYLYARIRAISSRVNKNYDGWPSVELAGGQDVFDRHVSHEGGFTVTADRSQRYGFSTFLGKPIFVDHNNSDPSRARGVIVDAKFHVDDHRTSAHDSYYSSKDVDPEHLPASWVELLLEVDAKAFPKFAKAIVEGSRNPKKGIDGWSMGCDVEKSVCSICKQAASSPEDYCDHVRLKGAYFDTVDPHTKKRTSKRAYENCYGVRFFEISGVFDPADETALSREVRSSKDKKEPLKDLADLQNEEWLEESAEEAKKRKQQKKKGAEFTPGSAPMGPPGQMSGQVECPNCVGTGADPQVAGQCPMCSGQGILRTTQPGGDGYTPDPVIDQRVFQPGGMIDPGNAEYGTPHEGGLRDWWAQGQLPEGVCPNCQGAGAVPGETMDTMCHYCNGTGKDGQGQSPNQGLMQDLSPYDPRMVTASTKTADNPPPQSEQYHAPEKVDTLREEHVCPVCGSSMDEDECDVCGYEEPPEGFGNPDLTKAQDVDLPVDHGDEQMENDLNPLPDSDHPQPAQPVNTPANPSALSHVTRDMESKTSAKINKTERPLVSGNKPQTNEPQEKILSDQSTPVTSHVRTAQDFIAAAGATRGNQMNHTAEAASGVPEAASPDVRTDVEGVGGVDQASNEAASKADAQIDVTGIGGTGVEGVAADEEGVTVDRGTEHSKNIEAIPTKTWHTQERQHDPVTNEVFRGEGGRSSNWQVEGHDDAVFPDDEISGGGAVKGVKPIAENFGERVDVLDHVTSPSNNSGPTTTWTGTDGNGVTKQQDPVTPDSIAKGESNLDGSPNWTSSTHIFAAFKLADLEVEMGLIPAEQKYARAAELENESPVALSTSLKYAQRVRQAAVRSRTASAKKLPVMGRATPVESTLNKEASTSPSGEDDSFMFGGV